MTDVQTRNQLFWPSPASIYLLQYINRTNFAFPAANHNKTRSTTMTHKILSSFLHPVNHLCLENLHGWHFPVATCRNVWRRNGGAHFRTSWKALKRVKEKSKSTAKPSLVKTRQKQVGLSPHLKRFYLGINLQGDENGIILYLKLTVRSCLS